MKSLSIALAVLVLTATTVTYTGAQAKTDLSKDSGTRSYKVEVSGPKRWVGPANIRSQSSLEFFIALEFQAVVAGRDYARSRTSYSVINVGDVEVLPPSEYPEHEVTDLKRFREIAVISLHTIQQSQCTPMLVELG